MIQITDSAINKVRDLLVEEKLPNGALRMFVQGGGCSGYQYGFTFDEEVAEDDFVIENEEKYRASYNNEWIWGDPLKIDNFVNDCYDTYFKNMKKAMREISKCA